MARLDPKRNLPPASEAWGKTIEQRISYLERANTLLQSETKNTSKGLNSLTTQVNSKSITSYEGSNVRTEFNMSDNNEEWMPAQTPVTGVAASRTVLFQGFYTLDVDLGTSTPINYMDDVSIGVLDESGSLVSERFYSFMEPLLQYWNGGSWKYSLNFVMPIELTGREYHLDLGVKVGIRSPISPSATLAIITYNSSVISL